MSLMSSPCSYCSFEVPISSDRCPHCARPSLFPNVTLASAQAQVDALERRLSSVTATLTGRLEVVLKEFIDEVNSRSEAVIARPASEVLRLASNDRELYASFYGLIDADNRLPTDGYWDSVREIVDSKFFPYFKEHMRFGALTLDGKGLSNYGDCFVLLRADMIGHRSTVFEENTIVFCQKNSVGLLIDIPAGHAAIWEKRGQLAGVKLHQRLQDGMRPQDFKPLLLSSGKSSSDDNFIEVHVYGSISIHSVSSVSVDRRKSSVKIRALREKLAKHGISVREH